MRVPCPTHVWSECHFATAPAAATCAKLQLLIWILARELRLPVLGGVEDVQNVNRCGSDTEDDDMAVPPGLATDDDVVQIGPAGHHVAQLI